MEHWFGRFLDYKTSNIKKFRYIFIIIDSFSKYVWAIPLRNENSKTITDEFPNVLIKSKRKPPTIESDRAGDWYNSNFWNFLKAKKIQHYSRFTDKGPSIAERVKRTIRNLLKEPVFEKGKANWLSEIPSVIKQYNKTIHNSMKMTPIQVSKKSTDREVSSNLQDRRVKQQQKCKLWQLVRTGDFKKVFSGDSTNYSYILYTKTEVIHNILPSYRIDYLPERYSQNLLLPTKLTLEENNKILKRVLIFQWNKLKNGNK